MNALVQKEENLSAAGIPADATVRDAPRVLYLPNESDLREGNGQVGGRAAFREMEQCRAIEELGIYSFLADYRSHGDKARTRQTLLDTVRAFQPDIIFWQHPDDFPIDRDLISAVRACGSSPLLAYHEADTFDPFYKPLDQSGKTLYVESDVFFTSALGVARRQFERLKLHPHFYYLPSCVDRERFSLQPVNHSPMDKQYDAVMFGNVVTRFRTITQSDSKRRIQLARRLTELFGERFAAFGRGWPSGTNRRGLFPYEKQMEMLQQSRMSVIWEHYSEHTFYFSDRLPISLAAGVPFITSRHGGYDTLFARVPGLFYVDTIEDAVDAAIYLKSMGDEEIAEMGMAARNWMLENLETRVVFRRGLEICRRAWRLKRKGIRAISNK